MGEAKEVLSLQMSRAHDKEIPYVYLYIYISIYKPNFFHGDKERRGKVKHEESFQNYPFGHIVKISLSTFWCMATSLGPRSVYT
jgi:hypothetical protein